MKKTAIIDKVLVTASFFIMILIHLLADFIPFNGRTTADVMNSYPILFAPSSYTFYAWIAIYVLSISFVIYQLDLYRSGRTQVRPEKYHRLRLLFAAVCLLVVVWVIAWHYDYIAFSLFLSIIITVCLGAVNRTLYLEELTHSERLFIKPLFGIYMGWILFMTINCFIILFESVRYESIMSEMTWTILIVVITTIISGYYTLRNRNIYFGLTMVWSFIGILIKHLSKTELNGQYPLVIVAVILGILILLGCSLYKRGQAP